MSHDPSYHAIPSTIIPLPAVVSTPRNWRSKVSISRVLKSVLTVVVITLSVAFFFTRTSIGLGMLGRFIDGRSSYELQSYELQSYEPESYEPAFYRYSYNDDSYRQMSDRDGSLASEVSLSPDFNTQRVPYVVEFCRQVLRTCHIPKNVPLCKWCKASHHN